MFSKYFGNYLNNCKWDKNDYLSQQPRRRIKHECTMDVFIKVSHTHDCYTVYYVMKSPEQFPESARRDVSDADFPTRCSIVLPCSPLLLLMTTML